MSTAAGNAVQTPILEGCSIDGNLAEEREILREATCTTARSQSRPARYSLMRSFCDSVRKRLDPGVAEE